MDTIMKVETHEMSFTDKLAAVDRSEILAVLYWILAALVTNTTVSVLACALGFLHLGVAVFRLSSWKS